MSCYLVTWPTGARALICGRCESAEDYGAASVVMASPSDVGPDAECQWCRDLLDEGGDPDEDDDTEGGE